MMISSLFVFMVQLLISYCSEGTTEAQKGNREGKLCRRIR